MRESDRQAAVAEASEAELDEVLEGLSRPQKELSSRYFYDRRGSELFEEITGLDVYYLTRRERALLELQGAEWVATHRPSALVELGAGSARKSRILLDAMMKTGDEPLYLPVDVSGPFLEDTAAELTEEYPGLRVEPVVGDITEPLELPLELPRPAWFALLGSTIGNFPRDEAAGLVAGVARSMRPGDHFLLGADQRPGVFKTRERLEAAYNDDEGLTAAFNRNALRVVNGRLGADFDPESFEHRAFYNGDEHRIEMHLVAKRALQVRLDGEVVEIDEGESIRTEVSCKHDQQSMEDLFQAAGLELVDWTRDPEAFFALALGALPS